MSSTTPLPVPLYPTYTELCEFDFKNYPELKLFVDSGPSWRKQHWAWGSDFLNYVGRNKSEHTYLRFRTDVERFLLWVFLFKNKPVDGLRKSDILEYADFCWKPPLSWISLSSTDRFSYHNGFFQINSTWTPFRLSQTRGQVTDSKQEKKRYKPSQETLKATFTAITSFYRYLNNEEICYANPAQVAKSDCRYFIIDSQVKEVRRLSQKQWNYVLSTAEKRANQDPAYERGLFVIAALKGLFLRISELSERKTWSPAMNHFWKDASGNWWLKVFGKGRKLRDVSVPSEFLTYLKRYREYRGLPPLPDSSDASPLVEKIRGQGGMSSRHLTRIVREILDAAHDKMKLEQGEEPSRKLFEASSHWLRHTGASMEIERGRALKDLSEDLGHASMATTDTIYVQSDDKVRAISGKNRKV
ncbi:MAG: site-specific integrase [Gammaproteobacteria bacterium]|nr:site-specific integrase [Gammaproteobacteria bacterium]